MDQPTEGRTAGPVEIATRSEGLIAELKQADILVVGSPMYNFTVPSMLKAWIDHVVISGQTFRYMPEAKPQGLPTGEKAYLALASGGVYIGRRWTIWRATCAQSSA